MNSFETKTYFVLDYDEFDNLVQNQYGRAYDCVVDEEWNNNESHTFHIKKNDEVVFNNINAYRKGKRVQYLAHSFLQDMVNNNVIPEGNYLIDINW